jgi:nucleoside phosphorylase
VLAAALLVALLAVALTLAAYVSQVRQLGRVRDEVEERAERAAIAEHAVERGLAGTVNSLEFAAGLLQRILEDRDTDVTIAVEEFQSLRREVERAWSEMRLLAGGRTAQTSALQQLTNRLGDVATSEMLLRAADSGGLEDVEPEKLRDAARQIEDRLTVDVLFVTATKVETVALLDAFGFPAGTPPPRRTIGQLVYYDLGEHGGASAWLVQTAGTGTIGPGGATLIILEGIDTLDPYWVLLVGIAFGVDESKQQLGDVLVANRIKTYEMQRVGTSEGKLVLTDRNVTIPPSHALLARLMSAELDAKVNVISGVILTGEKLIDNVDFRSSLLALSEEAIGGEMEAAGLWASAELRKRDWGIVKAICDWGDGNKKVDKASRQADAAGNSAAFVAHATREGLLTRPDTPTR